MSNQQNGSPASKLTATFYPGGNDDYYIPVVAPVPQRSMHEVTGQIQEGIEHLNLSSRPDSASPGLPSPTAMNRRQYSADHGYPRQDASRQPSGAYGQFNNAPPQPDYGAQARASPRPSTGRSSQATPQPRQDEPASVFPPIRDRPSTVPPSPEEKEQTLEKARQTVLTSNDPEMQVTWAQDTLTFVDAALENEGRMAETGHARAQTPQIERQLRIDAVSVLSFLADQHHPRAEFLRGMWLEFGKFGFECDKREAYRCYSRAAQNGYARAEYRMGMQFESSNEIDKAIKHYNLGIQGHDAASFYRMGMMNLLGQHGHSTNIQKGLDFIAFSADNADENAPQGAYVYGMLFNRELPQVSIPDQYLPHDTGKAAFYIEKAAYLGFARAQVKMGAAYELGQMNLPFDPVYSLHYNVLAARQGEPEAEMAISKWYLSGYEGVFQKNEALAYEYAQRAAQAGFPTAEFAMGYFNEVGIHVPVNLSEAKVWYGRAAEHGNDDAKGRISGISRSKTLSRKDHDKVALAKINSTRARPGQRPERFGGRAQAQDPAPAPVQQNVMMPHIDNYISSAGPDDYQSFNQNPFDSPVQPTHPGYGNAYPTGPPVGAMGQKPRPNYGSLDSIGRPPQPPNPYERTNSSVSSLSSSSYGNAPPSSVSSMSGPTSVPPVNEPGYRQSPLPQGYRVSSAGLPASPAPGRQNYNNPNKPLPSPSPAADIGFSAPPDYSGADRRRVASGPGPGGRPLPGNDPRPNRLGTPSQPAGGMPPPASYSHPPRQGSLPVRPGTNAPGVTPTPPPSNLGARPPGHAATAPAAAAQKPSKGPATFEAMGIPHAKQENDCIIM